MNVLHVSPAGFGPGAIVGGGERYAHELARAMTAQVAVTLLTFGRTREVRDDGGLRVERLPAGVLRRWHPLAANPLRHRFVQLIRWADIVHAHHVATLTTAAAVLLGRAFRKATFVTDLGGGHPYAPSNYLPILRHVSGMLLLSEYSRRIWRTRPERERPSRLEVISGGVDLERFRPAAPAPRVNGALFVGRVLPHKGLDYLIDAIPPRLPLTVVGRPYDAAYARALNARAAGRPVAFRTDVDDDDLVTCYQRATVTVLPSVYETAAGARTRVPELLGLAVIESMACGTPVIVTDVGSLPEIVEDGETGFIVPPNDATAIRDRLEHLMQRPEEVARMGARCRARAVERFNWDTVVARCLRAYLAPGGAHP